MKKYILPIVLVALLMGCSSLKKSTLKSDPYYVSFYEKASLIMTKYEKQVYRYLPTPQARRDFIENFWQRRDPTPETEDNENKMEFERRIVFANKWFHEGRIKRGWDTARGRILLQLGFPDRRYMDNMQSANYSTKRTPIEQWYYIYDDLALTFIDRNETGVFTLYQPPPGLLSAIDNTQARYDLVRLNKTKRSLKFKTTYKDGLISIRIPIKDIFFIEKENQMTAKFQISIRVNLNYVEVETITKTDHLAKPSNEILNMKYHTIDIPYTMIKKGAYNFDLLIQDVFNQSKYRMVINKRN